VIELSGVEFGQDRQTLGHLTSFCGGFLKEGIYSNEPRSVEDVKHNSEQALAGNDQHTLQKLAKIHCKKG
jgi:hypothetical protein